MITIFNELNEDVKPEWEMLDISILAAHKYLTSDERKEKFLYEPCEVEGKVDGIKVQIFRVGNTGNNLKDFNVSYKNHIIYPQEFEYASQQKVKLNSINNSQFKILFEHLKKLDLSKIPMGIEFSVEFALKKPTLSSNYTKHGFVLLAYAKSTARIKGGLIKFNSGARQTEKVPYYAKIFKFNTPKPLFKGQLALFERGIIDDDLRKEYNKIKGSLNISNMDDYLQKIFDCFLALESPYGGKEEGVVIKFKDLLLKVQQVYQVDQEARAKIKLKYKEDDPTKEQAYWDKIRYYALEVTKGLPQATESKIGPVMEILARKLKFLKPNLKHSKKNDLQILDDIQTQAKEIIIRGMKGNNGCLFLGKFRILTQAHASIIKFGLKNFDSVTVCLVSSKETRKFEDLRRKMLELTFGDSIEIINHNTGYIKGIIKKSSHNINAVLCGTDRFADYTRQVSYDPNIQVVETPRTEEDISATKIIENIDNYAYFCMKTPKEIHKLYDEIRKVFK